MRHLKSLLTLALGLFFFNSCSEEECRGIFCENNCIEEIIGTWEVNNIQPNNCNPLTYNFSAQNNESIIAMTITNGTKNFTGNGLIEADCSSMTYTVQEGNNTIISGSINFFGNSLEDRSDFGCLFTAVKK